MFYTNTCSPVNRLFAYPPKSGDVRSTRQGRDALAAARPRLCRPWRLARQHTCPPAGQGRGGRRDMVEERQGRARAGGIWRVDRRVLGYPEAMRFWVPAVVSAIA